MMASPLLTLQSHLELSPEAPLPAPLVAELRVALGRWQAAGPARREVRDAALRRAAELLDPGARLSRWARAGRLAEALARFEAVGWRRIRAGARAPAGPLELALAEALGCGADPLRHRRKLWQLLPEQGQTASAILKLRRPAATDLEDHHGTPCHAVAVQPRRRSGRAP